MKYFSLGILSLACFYVFGQELEPEKVIKPLSKHILGFEVRSFTDNGGVVLSYRNVLNEKWNFLLAGSATSASFSNGRNGKVIEIVDSVQYIYSDLYNQSTVYEIEVGVERIYKKERCDFFLGASGRFLFNRIDSYERIYSRIVGEDFAPNFSEDNLGSYNQVQHSNSIGASFSLGLRYELTRKLKLQFKMDTVVDVFLDNSKKKLLNDTYYNGERDAIDVSFAKTELYNRLSLGVLYQF